MQLINSIWQVLHSSNIAVPRAMESSGVGREVSGLSPRAPVLPDSNRMLSGAGVMPFLPTIRQPMHFPLSSSGEAHAAEVWWFE